MSGETMLKLGGYSFGISTAAYAQLRRVTEYSWAETARVGQAAALQFTGIGTDKITLDGVIYPHYRGGIGQLDAMRKVAGNGRPLLLVSGLGDVLGDWVIKRVAETQSNFARAGAPLSQQFSISLRRYSNA